MYHINSKKSSSSRFRQQSEDHKLFLPLFLSAFDLFIAEIQIPDNSLAIHYFLDKSTYYCSPFSSDWVIRLWQIQWSRSLCIGIQREIPQGWKNRFFVGDRFRKCRQE